MLACSPVEGCPAASPIFIPVRFGATTWPPNPQTFAAPRRSRDAPLSGARLGGHDMAPKPPFVRRAPGGAVTRLCRARVLGATAWPPNPHSFAVPGGAVTRLRLARVLGATTGPPNPHSFAAPRRRRGAARAGCDGPRAAGDVRWLGAGGGASG